MLQDIDGECHVEAAMHICCERFNGDVQCDGCSTELRGERPPSETDEVERLPHRFNGGHVVSVLAQEDRECADATTDLEDPSTGDEVRLYEFQRDVALVQIRIEPQRYVRWFPSSGGDDLADDGWPIKGL